MRPLYQIAVYVRGAWVYQRAEKISINEAFHKKCTIDEKYYPQYVFQVVKSTTDLTALSPPSK